MRSKFVPLALGVVITILLSFLPFYPLWVEGRQFTQSGESLYHELQFVSMRAYYEYAQYAQTAWLETTRVVYFLLAFINPFVLLSFCWLAVRAFRKWTAR